MFAIMIFAHTPSTWPRCSINGMVQLPVGLRIHCGNIWHMFLVQRDFCHVDGTTAVAPQLQLTANASAILNGWNAQDERLWSSVFLTFLPLNADLVSRVEARTRYILRISDCRRSHWITHPYHRLCCLTKTTAWSHFSQFLLRLGVFQYRFLHWVSQTLSSYSRAVYPTHNILFTDYARLYRRGPAIMMFDGTLPYIHSDQECLSQAALTTGAQVMTDTAMCALIIQVAVPLLRLRYWAKDIFSMQLWLDFRATIHGPRGSRQIQWTRAMVRLTSCLKVMSLMKPIWSPIAPGCTVRSSSGVLVPCSIPGNAS